jgi:osmotically-inducible protein OsmY
MGALVRLVFALLIVAVIGAFFMGYRVKDGRVVDPSGAVATPGTLGHVDTAKAREAGATIGDKVAVGANAAQHALSNAALTGKIKAKMTLDDTLKGSSVSVESNDGAVTLTGTVISPAQHTRVLQLTRETEGVKSVADHLVER